MEESKNKIKEILKEFDEIMHKINRNTEVNLYKVLINQSDFDVTLYKLAKRKNIEDKNLKKQIISIIFDKKQSNQKFLKNNKFEAINQIKNYFEKEYLKRADLIFENSMDLVELQIESTIDEREEKLSSKGIYYDETYDFDSILARDFLKKLINSDLSIKIFQEQYYTSNKEEIIWIILSLCSSFYEKTNYFLKDKNQDNEEFNEPLTDDDLYVYKKLDAVRNPLETLDVFAENYETITLSCISYQYYSRELKENMKQTILEDRKGSIMLKINPISIISYKDVFGLKFPGEKLDSIRIGKETLNIVDDYIQQAFRGEIEHNNVYKSARELINGMYLYENVNNWFSYLISNVYENIINSKKPTKEDLKFVDTINTVYESTGDYKLLIQNSNFIDWILYKFYNFNQITYDEQSLEELHSLTKKEKVKVLRRINPFFQEGEEYYNK